MTEVAPWLVRLNVGGRAPDLITDLRACCAAPSWLEAVLAARPYPDATTLFAVSDAASLGLDDANLELALAAHPRIGERASGPDAAWSREEQLGMSAADREARGQMADANRRYEDRFAHVYLVCATGLAAHQLLARCLDRLDNDRTTERLVVLGELAKIARLRLTRLLDSNVANGSAS
jgi:2-oxo-4-hydroxy-4-carboxy-5-ureidoimidazoline decarboxylase